MSGFKDIVKGGWHPEKNRGSSYSSSGSSNSGMDKVRGLVGRGGGGGASSAAHSHQSAPLTTLVDPASFGPPPKHIHYHGPEAVAATSNASPRPPPPRVPPHPNQQPSPAATAGPPRLPPRLPPRQNSNPHELTPAPPPAYHEIDKSVPAPPAQGQLNQGALNRLGNAGINVPGFNIGSSASPAVNPRRTTSPAPLSPTSTNNGQHLGELQSRFSKMSTPSSEAPSTGTTWSQKQAALKTAGNLRQDPSNVSVSDMRSAASTANNFRERHGEQAAAGWKTASGLNQKYGISNKVGGFAAAAGGSSASAANNPASPSSAVGKKPPPPPPKKKGLSTGNSSVPTTPTTAEGNAPPVPLSSKPRF
ncbi:hypothetical protein DM02DRAFT_616912 [Periconia macrospinosa]|uniref:GMP synthase n=1 Tax=Periconia macrospinosa TaxID=97972 RepID=A0A2V1DIG3_9PLEO|nr:hypothetical protein DM02DRAFT_616912 [Periconia macrospinosa]